MLTSLASSGVWTPRTPEALRLPKSERLRKSLTLAQLPLSFIANAGQTDPAVRFQVRSMGGTFFFTPTEVVLSLPAPSSHVTEGASPDLQHAHNLKSEIRNLKPVLSPVEASEITIRLRFAGANPNPTVEGLEPLPGTANFLLGDDPTQWRTNVPTYAAVAYRELYPGIDLVYRGTAGVLKTEFTVKPGADPGMIRLVYRGMEALRLRENGALVLQTAAGELIEEVPTLYQEIGGRRVEVKGSYRLLGNGEVGFALGAYDAAHLLVIDPVLIYSTYLGGGSDEEAWGIAVDSAGSAYVVGWTYSSNFPMENPFDNTLGGGIDAFVTKLNPVGDGLVYSTYLGGSSSDYGWGIAVDGAGNAYVTGETGSIDFPTQNPWQPANAGGWDAFVAVLNPTGSGLVYSTYLGGSGYDGGNRIAVDGSGRAYVTGVTNSIDDFPTQNALQQNYGGGWTDAFVAVLNPTGSGLVYSTYLGGSDWDYGWGIAVDGAGNAYVTGETDSIDFPTQNPWQPANAGGWDAFVAVLNPTGSNLVYSTYLGGSDGEGGNRIAVDGIGRACVTGWTDSSGDFPTQNAWQQGYGGAQDAFVTVFDPTGSGLVYSTYLGGSGWDSGEGIAVDDTGQVYVTGGTGSGDFPTQDPLQVANAGDADVFVTVFNSSGSGLVYSTYLGGSGWDVGFAIAVDGAGNAYVTGSAPSPDFPTVNAFQAGLAGGSDTFVAKIGELVGACTVTSTADSGPGTLRACLQGAASGDRIDFDTAVFPLISPATIALTSGPLPDIAQGDLTIDASNAGVILDGSGLPSGNGFRLTSNGNTIRGMQILNFPDHGVEICCGAQDNTISSNIIAYNGGDGVRVDGSTTTGNTITHNSIHDNGGQGIENSDGGNAELAPPSVLGAVGNIVAGTAPPGSIVDVFGDDGDEGRFYLGSIIVDAQGNFEFAGWLTGLNVTATATDGAGNTSEFSSPVVREAAISDTFETNDYWTLAYPITTGDWVSYISWPFDVDFYKFRVPQRGSTVIFTLTDLAEDFDLALYSPTDVPSDTPLKDVPLKDVPLKDVPLKDVPLKDVPLKDVPLKDVPLKDVPLKDVPLKDVPLKDVSFRRGTEDEQVSDVVVYATDFYYVQVVGHNGAYSSSPYTLRVEVVPPSPIPTCTRTLPQGDPGAIYQPYDPGQTETIIVTNKQRLEQLYGSIPTDNLMAKLRDFADDTTVKGLVLPVETDPAVATAYDDWDQDVCDPEAANEVAGAIKNLLNTFFDDPAFSNLAYVVIVGSDEVVPFRRVLDIVYTSNERAYRDLAHVQQDSAHFGSLDGGYMWTDDFYVDFEPTNYAGRPLYVTNYAIGRLVETPEEIIALLDHYLSPGGTLLNATTSLAVGYDFLADSSQTIADTFVAQGLTNDTLINDVWTAQDLRDIFLGIHHDLNSINAHFQHWRLQPADRAAGLFESSEIDQPGVALTGTVNFSMGCHAGLSVCDLISTGVPITAALDFPHAFARKQAVFVGNTGYGYGDTAAPTLSEELMSSFAHNLGAEAQVAVGQAMLMAKQEHALNNMGFYGPYDEKVLIETTLYGPPMYRVSVPSPGGGLPKQGSKGQSASAPLHLRTSSQNGLIVHTYTVTPTFTAVNTPDGTYYTADDGVQAMLYRPLQPRVILDIALPGDEVAHGALFLSGSFTDIPNFDPVITMPVTETTRYEPQWIYTGWRPQGLSRINHFQTPQGLLERLVLILGQFHHTDVVSNHVEGIERLYDQVTYEVYYSDSDDITPPTLEEVSTIRQDVSPRPALESGASLQQTSTIRFVVKVSDASGVERVVVVYTDGTGPWESLDLTYDPDADEWTGELTGVTGEIAFMAQAVDGAGNVAASRAKGQYFTPIPVDAGADQTADEGDEIAFSGSGPTDATILWDFGDGLHVTGAYTPTHWYRDDGLFEARLRVSDEEGRIGMDALFATINNVPPTVSVDEFTPPPISPGEVVTFTAAFADPGVLDTHSATTDWGDGTVEPATVNQGAGSGTVYGFHAYPEEGTFAVEVCVTDDEGGAGCDSFQVIVQAPGPTPTPTATPTPTPTPAPIPVGGVIVPISKLELLTLRLSSGLAPWLGLAALMVATLVAVVIRRRRSGGA